MDVRIAGLFFSNMLHVEETIDMNGSIETHAFCLHDFGRGSVDGVQTYVTATFLNGLGPRCVGHIIQALTGCNV